MAAHAPPDGGSCPGGGGGAGQAGASPRPGGERGSQTLELALTVPMIVLLLVLVLHAGLVGLDLVAAQGMAREAARIAAVDTDAAVRHGARAAAGSRGVRVTLTPPDGARRPGDTVTARLELASRGFAAFGARVWVPARAAMRVEER